MRFRTMASRVRRARSTALIKTGVFRITRNPMYLSYVLILVGVALIVRSLTPYAVIPVFAILNLRDVESGGAI